MKRVSRQLFPSLAMEAASNGEVKVQKYMKWQTVDVDSEWLLVSHSSAMPQPTVIFKHYLTSPFEAASIARLGNSCLLTGLNLWSLCQLDIGLVYSTECLPALLLRRGWRLCL